MVDARNRPDAETLRHQYEQVCTTFRAIDDFRGKLLALWPILGGGSAALLASSQTSKMYLWAVGLFGVLVSFGIAVYEWNQTLRCDLLKKVGRRLERDMGFEIGESVFLSIPRGFHLRLTGPTVDELQEPIKEEEQESSRKHSLGFWESIWPFISKRPIKIGVASLIIYSSVTVGWIWLCLWGFVIRF